MQMKYEWHCYIKYVNVSTVTIKTIDYIKQAWSYCKFHIISNLLLKNFPIMMNKDDGMI